MKPGQNKPFYRPFSGLQDLVQKKQMNLAPSAEPKPDRQPRLTVQQEDALFLQSMVGVTPLHHDRHWQWPCGRITFQPPQNPEDDESVAALDCLVRTGRGFVISQTNEYMEACGPGVDPRIVRRLHQGRFTIQDHIDLHGFFVRQAEPVLRQFIRRSIRKGCQAVLIVHGRGLKSPCKPALKAKVFDWLTRGPLSAHVIALASARACDGGAGATYVLLRRRPISKRQRKLKSISRCG